jgi:AraC-like DNA-binding protein
MGPDHASSAGVVVGSLLLPGNAAGQAAQSVRCRGFAKVVSTPVRQRELPSEYLTMIVGLGDPLVLPGTTEGSSRSVGSFVSGLQHQSAVTQRHGRQCGVHVELPALAAYTLFGLPINELTDELVELPALLGPDTAELVERLASARTWRGAFAMLRATLVRRMTRGPQPTPAVAWVWQQLRATHGLARIDQLVHSTGVSHRHLAVRFREQVGMTPKAFARVLRFEHSLTLLRQDGASLASVADTAGYYDQSHFNRDFRAMAGASPSAFLRGRSTLSKTDPGGPG